MNNSQLDASIPVLTEIIGAEESADTALEEPAAMAVAAPVSVITLKSAASETPAVVETTPELDHGNWDRFERELSERVLHQVMERMDRGLEQHVRDCLANVLQVAQEELTSGLRNSLRLALRSAVRDAVAEEMEKRQFSIK